jgi:hypothetical protein
VSERDQRETYRDAAGNEHMVPSTSATAAGLVRISMAGRCRAGSPGRTLPLLLRARRRVDDEAHIAARVVAARSRECWVTTIETAAHAPLTPRPACGWPSICAGLPWRPSTARPSRRSHATPGYGSEITNPPAGRDPARSLLGGTGCARFFDPRSILVSEQSSRYPTARCIAAGQRRTTATSLARPPRWVRAAGALKAALQPCKNTPRVTQKWSITS